MLLRMKNTPKRFLALHALQERANEIFFPNALFRPLDGDLMVAGEGIHPTVILAGPLAQDFLGDRARLMNVAEEMDDVLRPGQQRDVPQNDDAVETVIAKNQQAAKQSGEGFHRSSSMLLPLTTRSSDRGPME